MKQLFTPCIIQTIVICCTIIIASLVGLSLYRIHKKVEQSWQGYVFISCILVILAVIIFSFVFYGDRDVLDFISLSSALISIILAIITIIYSFYSNSRSVGQTEKLQKAAETVQKATISYSDSAASLQENIQKIVAAVSRVEAKTDRLLDANTSSNSKMTKIFSNFNLEEYTKLFVKATSRAGVIIMYTCIESKDHNKPFPFSLISSDDDGRYVYGFLVALGSSGLVFLKTEYEKDLVTVSEYVLPLKKAINEKIKEYQSIERIKYQIEKIDKFFKE